MADYGQFIIADEHENAHEDIKMTKNRIKLLLAALWAAAIILLFGGRIAYEVSGVPAYGYLSMAYFVIINLIALSLVIIIVVRLKEWIEGQVAAFAERNDTMADCKAEMGLLRQSVERIEEKVSDIEYTLKTEAE
ncbi:MAG: hypothetical protein APR53_08190 [Methanoculleus sp. SDB]|nr:MAG: hypothetical protein APR53_08190 [Methanoculleus sp. SDB]